MKETWCSTSRIWDYTIVYVLNHTKIFGIELTNELEIIILTLELMEENSKVDDDRGECCINKTLKYFFHNTVILVI